MTTTRKERIPGSISRSVLRLIPERVVVFLHALATHPEIAAALAAGGYTKQSHADGVQLLADLCSVDPDSEEFAAHARRAAARYELEEWAKPHLARLGSAILYNQREHHETLFDGLLAQAEHDPTNAVRRLIQRVRRLPHVDDGPRALLAHRRFDDAEMDRLSELVEDALVPRPLESEQMKKSYEARLYALKLWYDDWTSAARTYARRRDWLIQLGLAARPRRRDAVFTGEAEPADPAGDTAVREES